MEKYLTRIFYLLRQIISSRVVSLFKSQIEILLARYLKIFVSLVYWFEMDCRLPD